MSKSPPGWVTVPLASVADVQLGRQRSPKNHVGPNMRPYLRAANVTWGGLALDDVKEMHFSPTEVATFRLSPGDILLSEASGSASEVGKPAVWRGEIVDCCFQNTLLRVRTGHVHSSYLFWFFKWLALSGQFARGSRGVGIHHLGAKALSEWDVPVAPAGEQVRIVNAIETEFSRIDAGVAALDRVRRNFKRLRAAVLQAAVLGRLPTGSVGPLQIQEAHLPAHTPVRRAGRLWGSGSVPQLTDEERASVPANWRWAKVGNLGTNPEATVQVGPMSMRSADFKETGVPVLNVGSVQWDSIDETKLNYLPIGIATAFARYRIAAGDVLFTRSGTVGRCAVAGERQNGWLMTFHLLRVRVEASKCLPEYLRMVFEGAPHVRRQARGAAIGTTRAGFNTRLLADIDVPLPPIAEQAAIVEAASLCLAQSAAVDIEALVRRAERLRRSVLTAAFSGNLVSHEAGDELVSVVPGSIVDGQVDFDGSRPGATVSGPMRGSV